METDSPNARVAANLPVLRAVRGLSVRDLSGRLADLGRPLLPSGITKIEQGQRRVDVDELVALAVALRVNPSRLLLGESASADEDIHLTPTITVSALAAWLWADAEAPLALRADESTDEDVLEDFQINSRPAEIRRRLRHPLMAAISNLRASAGRVIGDASGWGDASDLESSLRFARRNLQRVAAELDAIEEESTHRG